MNNLFILKLFERERERERVVHFLLLFFLIYSRTSDDYKLFNISLIKIIIIHLIKT